MAIEHVARRAGTAALRTAAAALGQTEPARDVAQEVALTAVSKLGKLRDPDKFDAWVHRMTVRQAMRTLRASISRRDNETSWDSLAAGTEPTDRTDLDPAGRIAQRDGVMAALACLTPRQRLALALRYVHGLTEPEIAAALGCRPGTAGSLLSRGRTALKADPRLRHLIDTPAAEGTS